jgi:hypothetical protein
MPRSATDLPALVTDFVHKVRKVIQSRGHGGRTSVAKDLGINRRTLNDYLDEARPMQPGLDVLIRAIQRFDIVLEAGGLVLGRRQKITPSFVTRRGEPRAKRTEV